MGLNCQPGLLCWIQRGERGPDPLKNHQNIGFLSNTGQDRLKNHKAAKPAFNAWPSTARHANDGLPILEFDFSLPLMNYLKNVVKVGNKVGPLCQNCKRV